MDDSGELTINLNHSILEENDDETTLSLHETTPEKVDSARQMANPLLTSPEVKEYVQEQIREISHDFLNYQKDVMITLTEIKENFENEILNIKSGIRTMEEEMQEKDHSIHRLQNIITHQYKTDELHMSKDRGQESLYHANKPTNYQTKDKGVKYGERQAVPGKTGQIHANNDKAKQIADSCLNSLFDEDNMQNTNQNYAVLDRQRFHRGPSPNSPRVGKVSMKPQLFEGNEDLDEYLAQFDILAEINVWDYPTKSLYLAGSLKGGARALLNELDKEAQRDYDQLVSALNKRYGSAERAELFRARLQARVRGRDESLPELAQAIKKLTRQSYPSAPSSLTSVLALEHFIDAIPDGDIRMKLRESSPKSINEAETLAVRLEALRMSERQKGRLVRQAEVVQNQGTCSDTRKVIEQKEISNDLSEIKKVLSSLTKEIKGLAQNHDRGRQGGGNQYHNGQRRQFDNQNKNFGYANRNFNQTNSNGNFGTNRPNNYHQGNQGRSDSGVRARPF